MMYSAHTSIIQTITSSPVDSGPHELSLYYWPLRLVESKPSLSSLAQSTNVTTTLASWLISQRTKQRSSTMQSETQTKLKVSI